MTHRRTFLLLPILGLSVCVYIQRMDYFQPAISAIRNSIWMQKNRNTENFRASSARTVEAHENMDLYLRMTAADEMFVELYKKVLVQSMRYFWPNNNSMVVVLDQEKSHDHEFGDVISKEFPCPRICFMDEPTIRGYSGKDRMQRDMFYPEKCTSKKYVAYIDTDTMFITRIIPRNWFVEDKPIIIAIYGKEKTDFWGTVAKSTAQLFKTNEIMRCMANFPIIIKAAHLAELRQYIENLHNMSFDEVLITKSATRFAQFNLMCQYLWMFHRNEYVFHFQLQMEAASTISARADASYYEQVITAEQTFPIARSCAHFTYVYKRFLWRKQETYTHLFRSSMCFVGGFELCPEKCIQYNKSSVRIEMFDFGHNSWTWDSRCLKAQNDHYDELAKYRSTEYEDIIRNACYEIDTLIWDKTQVGKHIWIRTPN